MLDYLHSVEKRLPKLMEKSSNWKTKLVLYEKPVVERLWMQDGENRIYLHCIHPIDTEAGQRAFLHDHVWPSAMKILHGSYEMEFGVLHGASSKFILTKGSEYEMVDPALIHSVSPIGHPCFSLMVTGPLYPGMPALPATQKAQNAELSKERADFLLTAFKLLINN